jgi:glycosyltransferase involved in cell wall biosynthesis
MHIVFLTSEFPKLNAKHGGVGTFIKALASQLVIHQIKVSVIGIYNLDTNKSFTEEGIEVYGIKSSNWKLGKFYQNSRRLVDTLKKIHKKNAIDFVEGAELAFAFFPKKTPYKKIIRMHGGHHFFAVTLGKKPALWRGFQERQSFQKANAIIAVSNYVGRITSELLHLKKDYKTLYNPIDMQQFYFSNTQKVIPNSLLFVGTVCEKKGVRQLVESMYRVVEQFPDVVLNIVGRDWLYQNGKSYIEEMQSLISDKIRNNIHFIGAVSHDELPHWIEKSEVCIYPSLSESFGLTVIEAQAMGKPVILSDIEVFQEIVNPKDVLFCKSGESQDLADKIIWMLTNKDVALQMGNKAGASVLSRFDVKELVKENINFYKNLL